jgi:hypothetical protein
VEGFLTDTSTSGSQNKGANRTGGGDAVSGLLSQLGGLLQPAIAKVTGSGPTAVSPEMAEQVARRLSENPAFQTALLEALKASAPVTPSVVLTEPSPLASGSEIKMPSNNGSARS